MACWRSLPEIAGAISKPRKIEAVQVDASAVAGPGRAATSAILHRLSNATTGWSRLINDLERPRHAAINRPGNVIGYPAFVRAGRGSGATEQMLGDFMNAGAEGGLGGHIRGAEIVIGCEDLSPTLQFFTERLGFRLDRIQPAEGPTVATVSGHGVTLRLESRARTDAAGPTTLRLQCDLSSLPAGQPRALVAPGGTRILLVATEAAMDLPAGRQELVIARAGGDAVWATGRAGMLYRDLLPGRLGGRFIASHIRIPTGGPVPDYVHFHRVRFQMIFCRAGWAKLVYEDQGEPFVLGAGDCVLQPPQIRHRVLEASPGLEVIEIGCPSAHETVVDHALTLPNGRLAPDRLFDGQSFVRHVAAAVPWEDWRATGFEARDTGIGAATAGLASARVVRPRPARQSDADREGHSAKFAAHGGEFLFLFVLKGGLALDIEDAGRHILRSDDSVAIPAGVGYGLQADANLEMLEVALPETPEIP
jgi:quercetin dioxygenase-like cupin family protein